jgi:inhibitor of KinA
MTIAPLGDSALLVRVGDSLGEVLETTRRLRRARIPGIEEVVPAFASVSVFLKSPLDNERCLARIRAALRGPAISRAVKAPRLLEIPVCYDAEFGLDLTVVAKQTRLSPNEIARCHARAKYRVRCVGFTPGFPYLEGLPQILASPRRASPRTSVPPGSVAIGGRQTGIYPLVSPGGWNIIGRTPLRLFDLTREHAALLRAGDAVRFVAITREEFERWEK